MFYRSRKVLGNRDCVIVKEVDEFTTRGLQSGIPLYGRLVPASDNRFDLVSRIIEGASSFRC